MIEIPLKSRWSLVQLKFQHCFNIPDNWNTIEIPLIYGQDFNIVSILKQGAKWCWINIRIWCCFNDLMLTTECWFNIVSMTVCYLGKTTHFNVAWMTSRWSYDVCLYRTGDVTLLKWAEDLACSLAYLLKTLHRIKHIR